MDMNNQVLFCLLLLLQSGTTPVPQQGTNPTSTPNSTQQAPAAACKQPCLEDGTPVRLRMSQTVTESEFATIIGRYIPILGVAELPDFITLNMLARKITHNSLLVR